MAFKYSDGQIYESDFHYRYVNGRKPVKELKTEIEEFIEPIVEGGSISGIERSLMTHPAHELSGRQRVRGKGRGPEWC